MHVELAVLSQCMMNTSNNNFAYEIEVDKNINNKFFSYKKEQW